MGDYLGMSLAWNTLGVEIFCGSSKNMTPLNSSVKMSPHDEGDNFIERKGTATG
jgi:hypothetical protein